MLDMTCDFLTLARKRYACRSFTAEQLTAEELTCILEAACAAPSAWNNQSYRLCVVQSEEGLAAIDACTKCRYGAPTVIVGAYDSTVSSHPNAHWGPETCDYGDLDCAIALTHVMMAATSLGLASCWVGAFHPEATRKVLGFPATYRVVEMVMLGHAAMGPGPHHKRSLPMEDLVWRERFS